MNRLWRSEIFGHGYTGLTHNQIVDYYRKKRPVAVDFHENPGLIRTSATNTEADVQKNLDGETLIAAIKQLDEQSPGSYRDALHQRA